MRPVRSVASRLTEWACVATISGSSRYRLGVRTRGSQPRDRGSNPRSGTNSRHAPPERRLFGLSPDARGFVDADTTNDDDAAARRRTAGCLSAALGRCVPRLGISAVRPHDCRGAVSTVVGFAQAVPRARLVPRREVWHLGALDCAVRSGARRLVRAPDVPPG